MEGTASASASHCLRWSPASFASPEASLGSSWWRGEDDSLAGPVCYHGVSELAVLYVFSMRMMFSPPAQSDVEITQWNGPMAITERILNP